jgi:hypothetical protein
VAHHADIDFDDTESFSVYGLFQKIDNFTATSTLFSKGQAADTAYGYMGYCSNVDQFVARIGTPLAQVDSTIGLGTGSHRYGAGLVRNLVTVTELEGFLDGTGTGSPDTSASGTTANTQPLRFGATGVATPSLYMKGCILGMAVFDEALSDADMATLDTELKASYTSNAYSIAGDVTVGTAVASTMAYTGDNEIVGAVPVTVTVAGDFDYGWEFAGSVTVTPTIAAAMFYGADITGGVVVNIAVASDMDYGGAAEIAGAVTVNIAIAGGMDYTAATYDYTIDGDISVEVAVAADLDFAVELEGDITVNIAVASGLSYGKVLSGAVPVVVTPDSALDYTFIREIDGDVTVNIGVRGRTAGSVVQNVFALQKMHLGYMELEI